MKKRLSYLMGIILLASMPFMYAQDEASHHASRTVAPHVTGHNAHYAACKGCCYNLDEAVEQHWMIMLSIYGSLTYEAYDENGFSRSLASHLFAPCIDKCTDICKKETFDPLRIRDVHLVSRLSDENKVRLGGGDQLEPIRPAGSDKAFGSYRSDQYLALIAPTLLDFDAEQREEGFNLNAAYRHRVTDNIELYFGMNLPIKSVLHVLDLKLQNGSLFNAGFASNDTIRSDSLKYFFQQFIDVRDFVQRAIFDSKALSFEPRRRKTGIGDVSFFALADFGRYFDCVDSLQVGFNLVAPSGGKANEKNIWDTCLGNGGAVQFEGYANIIFHSPIRAFNPSLRFVGAGSASYTHDRRVPEFVSSEEQVQLQNVPGLLMSQPVLATFGSYEVDPFCQVDSLVPQFADHTVPTRTKQGARGLFGIGNYFYNIFHQDFRLGVFYDFSLKGEDSVCVLCCPTRIAAGCPEITSEPCFDTKALERCTDTRMHRIGWNLTYKCLGRFELNFGSEHVIGGKNVGRYHEVFASLIATF